MMAGRTYLEITVLIDKDVARFLPESQLWTLWQDRMLLPNHDARHRQSVHIWVHAANGENVSYQMTQTIHTRIWYKKYWINCFSNGLDVNSRWRSVPRSSVTKYLRKTDRIKMNIMSVMKNTNRSSRGEMNTSLRLMIYRRKKKLVSEWEIH